ncbi:hypothetical protein V6N11_017417 [Hibiscus sabdariffa]|uniref:Retrotransposon protein, putative, Ty1-copia subclass n=1 Tax=Hibiscus sabdariffa TaxID=183260 RepID=A0ABR2TY13_9ROSI
MSQISYASAIGSIMYAMICTRPDLSYALNMTSRYQANPGEGNWTAVKNILKYLRRTKDVFLFYGGEEELVNRKPKVFVPKLDDLIEEHYDSTCSQMEWAEWRRSGLQLMLPRVGR